MSVDIWEYKDIILNGLSDESQIIIPIKDIEKYKYFTKFIHSHIIKSNIFIPSSYVVGYNIMTIDGFKWMPVFNQYHVTNRNILNKQFKEKCKQLQLEALQNIGFPSVVVKIISEYL